MTGPGDPGWTDPYLRSKVEAELVGLELERAGLPRVTIHPGTVIGPEDTAMGTSSGYVTNLLAGGVALDTQANWVDVRDVAKAILLAMAQPAGRHFVLTSGVVKLRDVATMLDELTGRRVRRRFLGPATVRRLARINDLFGGRLSALPPLDSLDWILGNADVVDTTAARTVLGLEFRPLRDTLADAIRWWAEHDLVDRELAGKLAPTPV
jgi:nucleoside-diphosphate-sugar epimerase